MLLVARTTLYWLRRLCPHWLVSPIIAATLLRASTYRSTGIPEWKLYALTAQAGRVTATALLYIAEVHLVIFVIPLLSALFAGKTVLRLQSNPRPWFIRAAYRVEITTAHSGHQRPRVAELPDDSPVKQIGEQCRALVS